MEEVVQRTGVAGAGNVHQSPDLYGTLLPEPSHRFSTQHVFQ